MPVYVLADVTIHDPVTYEHYKEMAPASIFRYGGRYAVRGATVATLEGEWKTNRLVVLEFPTAERAHAWWDSPEYAPAKALRQSCARSAIVLVEGPSLDPPA